MYDLKDPLSGLPYKKRTRIIGNLPSLSLVSTTCDGSHTHEPVVGKVKFDGAWVSRSTLAGAYPRSLCRNLAQLVVGDLATSQSMRRRRLAQAY